jgi:hypothetical protein
MNTTLLIRLSATAAALSLVALVSSAAAGGVPRPLGAGQQKLSPGVHVLDLVSREQGRAGYMPWATRKQRTELDRIVHSITFLSVPSRKPASTASGREAATARIIRVTSPVHRGDYPTLVARIVPSRRCTIAVFYDRGRSTDPGLHPKRPIDHGVSWTWKVGIRTRTGRWPIRVACGSAGSFRTSFVVKRAE